MIVAATAAVALATTSVHPQQKSSAATCNMTAMREDSWMEVIAIHRSKANSLINNNPPFGHTMCGRQLERSVKNCAMTD